jgi:hypothetical protein
MSRLKSCPDTTHECSCGGMKIWLGSREVCSSNRIFHPKAERVTNNRVTRPCSAESKDPGGAYFARAVWSFSTTEAHIHRVVAFVRTLHKTVILRVCVLQKTRHLKQEILSRPKGKDPGVYPDFVPRGAINDHARTFSTPGNSTGYPGLAECRDLLFSGRS